VTKKRVLTAHLPYAGDEGQRGEQNSCPPTAEFLFAAANFVEYL
jgi:hypothetical protein